MKKTTLFVLSLTVLLSCNNSDGKRILSDSSGKINDLSVVVDNLLWEGDVGEATRAVLGTPVYGLPQHEPTFTMRHMPPEIFTDFATKNRIVFKVEKGKSADTKIFKDVYAKPQTVVLVTGITNDEIIEQIEQNKSRIISAFKSQEIREKQRRIKISLGKNSAIERALNLTINFPSVYRIAKEDNGFFWIRKDLKTGSMNLMLYQLPLDAISDDESALNDIIRTRDSIGKIYIPGPVDGSYMITEEAYSPFLNKTIIDNKSTLETKSTWEVKNAFMAGPFINYVIEDKLNDRLIIAEGFTFAPSVNKRNHMFELEAIIRSIKIK